MNKKGGSPLPIMLAGVFTVSVAHAEAPMNVDDAGTLAKDGMKVEAVWQKDDRVVGGVLVFGFSPIENLELEIGGARDNDMDANPSEKMHGFGVGAKWVPYQNEMGWSLGGRFDYGQTLAEFGTEHVYEVTGLATYRMQNDQVLHLNAGLAHVRAQGEHVTVKTWGMGYEFPLTQGVMLTAEVFGEEKSGPDKAVGLRYEIFDGFKASAAIGQGNNRDFGQVGVAWEF